MKRYDLTIVVDDDRSEVARDLMEQAEARLRHVYLGTANIHLMEFNVDDPSGRLM